MKHNQGGVESQNIEHESLAWYHLHCVVLCLEEVQRVGLIFREEKQLFVKNRWVKNLEICNLNQVKVELVGICWAFGVQQGHVGHNLEWIYHSPEKVQASWEQDA